MEFGGWFISGRNVKVCVTMCMKMSQSESLSFILNRIGRVLSKTQCVCTCVPMQRRDSKKQGVYVDSLSERHRRTFKKDNKVQTRL